MASRRVTRRALNAATSTFSSTENALKSLTTWKVRTTPARAIRWGVHPAMSVPPTQTSPSVMRSIPVRTLISVVLPEPFGPMSPRISPRPRVRLTPSTARKPA